MRIGTGASVAWSSEQAPFTSEFVGSIIATDSCEKSQSMLSRKSCKKVQITQNIEFTA
jgi:hypothetical protein